MKTKEEKVSKNRANNSEKQEYEMPDPATLQLNITNEQKLGR